ncbi:MAG: SufD family Fe-S cluster assembly protein, partial [Gemmatales bacterium]|nr:SufD family Fe-S cluster assembly protein [Gemmatales bacterium]MDW8385992.1 SufD family Fe-S cluster assembly protein [Gemmatales bacterium]
MTTIQTASDKRSYVEQFERLEREVAGSDAPAVRHLRLAAIARFDQIGFPTSRNEDWRFTSVAELLKVPFHPAPALDDLPIGEEDLAPFTFGEAVRLVFVNGRFVKELSRVRPLGPGVILGSLADGLLREPELLAGHLGRIADFKDQPFTALNSAFFRDGAVLVVPDGVTLDEPIHVVHVALGGSSPWVCYPRNLVVLGRGSRASVIESWVGFPPTSSQEPTFTDAVTEVVVAAEAVCDHVRVQREDRRAFHFSNLAVGLGTSARFTTHLVSLGGGWVRNESRVRFSGQNAEATVNGLYFGRGTQHVD